MSESRAVLGGSTTWDILISPESVGSMIGFNPLDNTAKRTMTVGNSLLTR